MPKTLDRTVQRQQAFASKRPATRTNASANACERDHTERDRLLDVNEAAEMLAIERSTLYQWAYERRIPVVKLFGRALRFRLSDIEKLIADSVRPALS